MPKKDMVKELYSKVQQLRREPDTSKRPNKWREAYINDLGSLLSRYTVLARKYAKLETYIKSLAE
jgi:hypothetical protein